MYKTSLDPSTIAAIKAIPTDTKWLIVAGAVVTIALLVYVFKLKAAVPFALAFGGIAYVTYIDSGITVLGVVNAALAVGVLWLGFKFRSMASAKTKTAAAAEPAHA